MYQKLGYSIYRIVNKYYSSSHDSSGEDAFGIAYLTLFRHEESTKARPLRHSL